MKKLYFLENDSHGAAERALRHYVKPLIVDSQQSNEELLSSLENINIISELWKLPIDETMKLVYNPDNAIFTWSMYTQSLKADSRSQLIKLLVEAGRCEVKNCTYVDMVGEITKVITNYLDDFSANGVICILRAIELNNIITFMNGNFHKLIVSITKDEIFDFVPINLTNHLQ